MTGLGEVCTHIAAVLFYLEAAYRIKEVETCTQVKCLLAMPSFLSKIEYCPTKDIDFTPPCTKKKRFDCLSSAQLQEQGQQTQQVSVILPDDNEMSTFSESFS